MDCGHFRIRKLLPPRILQFGTETLTSMGTFSVAVILHWALCLFSHLPYPVVRMYGIISLDSMQNNVFSQYLTNMTILNKYQWGKNNSKNESLLLLRQLIIIENQYDPAFKILTKYSSLTYSMAMSFQLITFIPFVPPTILLICFLSSSILSLQLNMVTAFLCTKASQVFVIFQHFQFINRNFLFTIIFICIAMRVNVKSQSHFKMTKIT